MRPKIEIPPTFGGSWDAFLQEWCCGGCLGYSPSEVSRALFTLVRLWPDGVTRLVNESSRGLAVAASKVELGLLLDACEIADGFANVFRRFANGERSAYSELVLGAALQRLAGAFRFEPPLDGNVLDAECEIHSVPVFFEVVAPERSDASVANELLVDSLTAAVLARVSKCRVEIELRGSLDAESIGAIGDAIAAAAPSTWMLVDSLARVRRIDAGRPLVPTFDGEGAQVVVAGERTIQGESTSVNVRWESTDARAKRVFNDEYHQFSRAVANVLVVNVCAVADGMRVWPRKMARLLQPTQNRKVGAVVFFDQGLLGPREAIRRRWRVVVNPYAHLQVPEQILAGFESLDESHAYGFPRPARIVAA